MPNSSIGRNRIDDKTKLLLKFNYTSSILSLLLALICVYAIDVQGTIPFIFFFYFALNLINTGAFKVHHNLTSMAINTSVLSWVSTVIITLFSGGINSPFIFVLAIIVLAGYIATRVFGRIYLYFITFTIFLIFFVGQLELHFISNEVPEKSRDIFSLFSLLFSVYLLGGIFGKDLLKAHHNLYKSKAEIEKRIHEKETLLREVHHRVKNNLQTVSSLLNLQAKNSANQEIKDLVKSSQNRVTSMAMIHEMLYTHNDLSKIAFRPYVKELTDYLLNSHKNKDKKVDILITMPDTKLSIDTAIPLGLLINETVTNSLKYGFVEKQEGQIDISLIKTQQPNTFILKIADNGIGFSEDLDHRTTNSLGLKLIHNLARQLKGSVERANDEKGTTYTVHFQEIEK